MLISPYVCKVVEELTNPYNKSIANKKVKFTNEKFLKKQKFEEYELNLDEYVHFSNITLQQIAGDRHQEHSMIDIKMNYIENIFDMLNLTKIACTGKISLEYNLFVNSRELHKLNIGFMDDLDKLEKNIIVHTYDPPSKINILTKDIKDFIQIRRIVKKIYDRLEGSVCRYGDFTFNSIALAANPKINVTDSEKRYPTEAHANILLIMKNSRTNLITIILYEPHGSTDKKFDLTTKLIRQLNNYFINLIQYHLKEFYKSAGTPYTIDIIEQKSVSCPEGIQTYINDSLGYCELISTLWLYLVLGLFSSSELDPNVKITLVNRLHIVESCLYQLYKTPEELYNVVVNFSVEVINNYLKLINYRKLSIDFTRNFYREMYRKYEDNIHTKIKIASPIVEEPIFKQPIIKQPNCKKCNRKNDCKSRNCVNRICSPPHFYTKYQDMKKIQFLPGETYKPEGNLPKTIGDKCDAHKECCSLRCLNGYCINRTV
jgi:hypothetical protein